ncbi:autotransporter outer membrane beta-barrel domain-containing protein (plasmid) [Rhizobium sp. CB3090]|uniref:autotransporter-associated beta strand repeat-containing protein n=1 Tax=Rhizobium sp. CB3090 TaxID=3039156 RepID=UPI0024B217E6|nr:autotransporter-associated beta strand repeat-containing protein [Rhizobium sp. CB3090]WFU13314.1 autotransporter outer membrane beta-barrel domain-containing protein [Rhizobium sp. CB3090]
MSSIAIAVAQRAKIKSRSRRFSTVFSSVGRGKGRDWKRRSHALLAGVSLGTMVACGWPAPAGAQVWKGTTSTDWTVGSNWSTGTAPNGTGTVTINTNSPNPAVLGVSGAASSTIGNLQMGTTTGTSVLTIQNGSMLSSSVTTGTNYIGQAGNGTVTVTGAGSSWSSSAQTRIGFNNGSTGTLNIANGASVSLGTLNFGGAGSAATGTLNVTGGGTLTSGDTFMFGSFTTSTANISGAGSSWNVGGFLTVGRGQGNSGTGSGTLNVTNGALVTATGIITIAGNNLSGAGTGTVTVSGAGSQLNTSAALNIGAYGQGTLTVSNGAAATANTVTMTAVAASTATLNLSGGSTLSTGQLTAGPGTVQANFDGATLRATASGQSPAFISGFTGTGLNIAAGGLTLDTGAFNVTAASPFSGTGALTKIGTGTAVFTGNNSYAGGTTISAGTLQLGSASTSGSITGDVSNNGTLAFDRSDTYTFAGLISGSGAVNQIGSGTTILTSDNGYTGGTTISAGTLQLGNGGASGSISGDVTNNGTLAFDRSDTSNFAGLISGSGGVNQIGSGTTVLTANNSYTGGTTISAGTLQLGNGGTSGAITGDVTNNGTLVFDRSDTSTFGGLISGSGAVNQIGSGTTVLTANNSYTGDTTIASGTLQLGNGGTSGSISGDVTNNGILAFDRSDTYTFAGLISGSGSVSQIGSGTTVLTANNGYTGGTTISAGTLQLGNGGVSGSIIGDVTNNGTLVFDRSDTSTFAGLISGSGAVNQIGSGTTVLTANNGYTGGTTISAGTLQLGNGGVSGSIIGDVTNNGTLVFDRSDTSTFAGLISGSGAVNQIGSGTTVLTANNGYTGGTTISAGTLQLGNGGVSGSIIGDVTNNGTLAFDRSDTYTFAGLISGSGAVNQIGSGTTVLTANNGYTGGTTISAGTLQLGNGGVSGSISGDVTNNGTLAFDRSDAYSFAGAISGTGTVSNLGSGITTLSGINSYSGATNVNAGTLLVNGDQSAATGLTTVASGATLGGIGTIGGDVTVTGGGTLSPGAAGNAPGTLTINGALALNSASNINVNFGQANASGGSLNDLITVGGNLTLDGTLNVTQTAGGTFGPGVYRIFNYGGTLTNNGLDITDPNYFVQTAVANQVNLVNSTGLTLSYWDGDVGPHSNSVIDGGNGTWRAAGDQNWTDGTGLFAAPFANGSFAIFQGAPGTVTVDNTNGQVQAAGMQFATNGYAIQGGDVELVGPQSTIRVGDGSTAGAAFAATIASNLTGSSELVKSDLGTLVLSGSNSYTGGTAINGGTLQISSDANLGAANGPLSLDGATLTNTASVVSNRTVTLNTGGGTFDALDTISLGGSVGGAGTLTKTGSGTLVLNGANSYQGGTVINGGTVQVASDANLGDAAGALTFNGGALHTTGSFTSARAATLSAGGGIFDTDNLTTLTLRSAIGGTGALTKSGTGTLVLAADNNYAGGTTIAAGTLQLGNGGASGSITGNVVDNGTLTFNRNDTYSFGGLISGTGGLDQSGSGVTILTANNSYAGATNVHTGTLIVNGDQSAATGATTVEAGGTIGGIGTIGGNVSVLDNGALNPGNVGSTPSTLTINGNLTLAANSTLNYNFGQAGMVGGPYNDLTLVHGNLTLGGLLNVSETPGGNFGPGIYRVISYDGTLTNLGLADNSPNYIVQTSVANQINLVNIAGLTLNYWDGDAGPKSNDLVNGGNGTWRAAGDDNWTDDTGHLNARFSNGSFAIFAGTAGTVQVDNTNGQVQAAGMQFATNGYTVQGDSVTLVGPQSIIRVGDGTSAGASYTATIASVLQGNSQLVKTDLGTLVLTGDNTFTGGTRINQGTLQFTSDANLGAVSGNLILDGGTLRNTTTLALARGATLGAGSGTFETIGDLTANGAIDGVGGFTKTGAAALTLTGANSYAGTTTVSAGSLYVNGNQGEATGLTSVQNGATLGGSGTIGGNVAIADGATLSPGSANGTPGTLSIAGNLTLSGGSILNYSLGQANAPGNSLNDVTTVGGNLVLDGTLNVTVPSGGIFGPGAYRLFNYAGTLTDNGLSFGSIPSTDYFLQTAIAHQVNLVNTAGLTLNYWDGGSGARGSGVINGGDGVWQVSTENDNWTNSTGVVNAPYRQAAFAVFAGNTGTVTVDNSHGQVTASGMQFMTDGYVIQGGAIELVGGPTTTIRVGDGTSAGAAITSTIASELAGTSQLVKTDAGTLVLAGNNSYTGGTTIDGGTLVNQGTIDQVTVNAGGTFTQAAGGAGAVTVNGGSTVNVAGGSVSGMVALTLAGGGTASQVNISGGALTSSAGPAILADGGNANINISGAPNLGSSNGDILQLTNGSNVTFTASSATLNGNIMSDASSTGLVNLTNGSVLSGSIDPVAMTIDASSRWSVTGNSSLTTLSNAGTVAYAAPSNPLDASTYHTATVDNYIGNGGVLALHTALGGDASPTDRLVVTGDTSGTSTVKVMNVGGAGAQTTDGIKIVSVGGASNGVFSLAGDYTFQGQQAVIGGAYAYRLYKGGVSTPSDGDWYLRSAYTLPAAPTDPVPAPQPLYAPGVPLYEAYAGVLQSFNELDTLQQRIGNRSWGNGEAMAQGTDILDQTPAGGKAIWARIEAAHSKFDPERSTTGADYTATTWKFEAGLDGLFYDSEAGALTGALSLHYGTVSSNVSSIFGTGSIDANGYGLGGSLTWYGNSGFYADAQAQATWYDTDLASATLGRKLTEGNNGFGYALSIETGQKFSLHDNWSLTPQAQLSYSSVRFDDFTDPYGARVSLDDGQSLISRIGLSADYESGWKNAAGQINRSHVYGIANLYYDFLDGSNVNVSGASLASKNQPLWGGVGLGGSLNLGGRTTVYGEAFARTSLADFGDSNAAGAKVGFKVSW